MKTITVKDVIERLQKLPPDMEVWNTWDESGESFPISQKAFESSEYSNGWLQPVTVIKRRVGNKLRYEEAHPRYERRAIKRSRTRKTVVMI